MRKEQKKRFSTGYKLLHVAGMVFAITVIAGCAAVKEYDWSNWWTFHKPLFEKIANIFKSDEKTETTEVKNETTNVNVTVNGNETKTETTKTETK